MSAWKDAAPLPKSKGILLHQQLRELIRTKIHSGVLAEGDLLPPEIELAELYAVSRTTARRALLDLTREGLLERISGKGTYVRLRRTEGMKAIVFICPFHRPVMAELAEGIEAVAKVEGYEVIIRNSSSDAEVEARQIQDVMSMDVAGVILWPKIPDFSLAPSAAVRALLSGPVPTVIVDQYAAGVDCVTTDNFGGGYLAAEHLLQLGRRHIGFVAEGDRLPYTVEARLLGLREALENSGAPAGGELFFSHWPDEDLFARWIEAERIDGVVCGNDRVAVGVLDALARQGVSVPEEVSVVGYDDAYFARTAKPPLTTVRQDFKSVGKSAGRLLVKRIRVPSLPTRHLSLPVRLCVRASCGAGVLTVSAPSGGAAGSQGDRRPSPVTEGVAG